MSRRVRWEAVSGTIAVVSLVAALVFNGLQVRESASAQRQARLATELGLLTQLQGVMNESVFSRVPYARQFEDLAAGRRTTVTHAAYEAVAREASNMDYFAWLFNHGYLTTPGADRLWGPRMICEWKQAFAPVFAHATQDLPELLKFVRERRYLSQPC
jgi:hypothetical protein